MRHLKILCALVVALSLSGCFATSPIQPFTGKKRDLGVRQDMAIFSVEFPQGGKDLGLEQKTAIQNFLNDFNPRQGDQLNVTFSAESNAQSIGQSETVLTYLRELGYKPSLMGTPPHIGENQVGIARFRPVVVLPGECPDWTKEAGSDHSNGTYSNFNCANMVNLGLMLANPMDLVKPNPMTPGDAQGSILGVQRYRTGETKDLGTKTPTVIPGEAEQAE